MAEASVPSVYKTCTTCKEDKPRDAFYPGHNPCKICLAAKAKARYWQNPEKGRAACKKWRTQNPGKAHAATKTWRSKNVEKVYEQEKAWRLNNPEKTRRHARTKYLKDGPTILAKNKAYRDNNAAKLLAARKEQRLAHLEHERARGRNPKYHPQARARVKAWRNTNRAKLHAQHKRRRARKKDAAVNDFTAAEWREMLDAYGHRCVYCGRKMQRLTQDHLTPLAKGGNHTKSNIVPACRSCNSKKGKGAPLVPVQPLLL
jgi:hypothetical protein